jgi:hypothetical protein
MCNGCLVFVGEFKKNVTRQIWRTQFHFGEYLFQSTRHFGECLKKLVSHTDIVGSNVKWKTLFSTPIAHAISIILYGPQQSSHYFVVMKNRLLSFNA